MKRKIKEKRANGGLFDVDLDAVNGGVVEPKRIRVFVDPETEIKRREKDDRQLKWIEADEWLKQLNQKSK